MKNNDKYENNMEEIEKEYAADNEYEGVDENEKKVEYEDDDAYDDEDEEQQPEDSDVRFCPESPES